MLESRAFVHVQHPMFDGRLYVKSSGAPLDFFPNSYFSDISYLKYFGKKSERNRSLGWPRERSYFSAKNCIKMPSIAREMDQIFAEASKKRYYDCKYRRLFTSDYPSLRLEIGFEANRIILKNESDFRRLAKGLIKQKVVVKHPSGSIIDAGLVSNSFKRSIMSALHVATLPSKDHSELHWGIVGGEPVAIVDYVVEDLRSIKFSNRVFDIFLREDYTGIRLSFFKEKADLEECGVWLIGIEKNQDIKRLIAEAREIRIGILKIHAYVEFLFASMAQIHLYGNDMREKIIEKYGVAVDAFGKGNWYGMNLGPKQGFIINCYNHVYQNRLREILSRVFEEIKSSEKSKRETMVNFTFNGDIYGEVTMTDRSVSVTGDGNQVVAGDYNKFRDVLININKGLEGGDSNSEIIKSLRTINEEVDRLVKDNKPSKVMQEDIEEKLTKLNNEATKPTPDRDYLKVTSKGLIEAAETIAKIVGGPAIAAITSLMGLFP